MLLKNNLLYTSETTQSIESGAPPTTGSQSTFNFFDYEKITLRL